MKMILCVGKDLEVPLNVPKRMNKWTSVVFHLQNVPQKASVKKTPNGDLKIELPPLHADFPVILKLQAEEDD